MTMREILPRQAVCWLGLLLLVAACNQPQPQPQPATSGPAVSEPSSDAVEQWERAAATGDQAAQYNLGVAYAMGDEVKRNMVEAHKWINLAAAKGDVASVRLLERLEFSMTMKQIGEAKRQAAAFVPKKPEKKAKAKPKEQ